MATMLDEANTTLVEFMKIIVCQMHQRWMKNMDNSNIGFILDCRHHYYNRCYCGRCSVVGKLWFLLDKGQSVSLINLSFHRKTLPIHSRKTLFSI